jgi:hypothetical protein
VASISFSISTSVRILGFDGAALDVTKRAHPESIFFEKAFPLCLRRRYQPNVMRALSRVLLAEELARIFSLLQESADGLTTFFRTVRSGGNGKPNFLA